ncbi:IS66 family transposase, partial [Patescibacteria group bacterium]|nr:IS66 family transposase [Patescibacteria group bacterium]
MGFWYVSSMTFDADNLPGNLQETHRLMRIMIEHMTYLEEQNALLRQAVFGAKSEKMKPAPANQLMLFGQNEPEQEVEFPEQEGPEHDSASQRKSKRGGRNAFPEHLPREEHLHDVPAEERICCGTQMQRIGEHTNERLRFVPAQLIVEKHIYPKYTCKVCEGINGNGPTVKQAPVEPQLIPKSMTTPSLLAYLFNAKFVEGMPFYRLEQRFMRDGIKISRNNMANWAIKSMDAMFVLYNLTADTMRAQNYLGIDETWMQVLKEADKSPQSKSFMWVVRAEYRGKPLIYYQYDPTRGSDVPRAFLEGYVGTVQSDGYAGYDFLDNLKHILHVACWGHSRRKFTDVLKAGGSKRKSGNADIALGFIRDLYQVERKARKLELSPEEIVALRKEEAVPVLDR